MSKTFRVAKIVYFTDLTSADARVIPLGSLSEVQLPHVHGLAIKARAALQPQELELINPLIRERLSAGPGLTVAEIRDLLGTTRKYAVPLCEYLDRVSVTRRDGDLRVPAT